MFCIFSSAECTSSTSSSVNLIVVHVRWTTPTLYSFLSLTRLGVVTGDKDKVSAFADADEGAGKGGEGKEKGQKGVNVTDVYAFNDAFK
jgi:hypothetical protein